ncbi:MAG: hypothetical protein NXI24_21800 [bacterium]|nr:hypothetical protein [bacterium]
MKFLRFWLPRLALLAYAGACQLILAVLHFVVSAPYLSLIFVPIPVLAPLLMVPDSWTFTRRAYLCLQLFGVTLQMVARVWLDLWIPVRI